MTHRFVTATFLLLGLGTACEDGTAPRPDVEGPLALEVLAPHNFQLAYDEVEVRASCTGCRDIAARLQPGGGSGGWNAVQDLAAGYAVIDTKVSLSVSPGTYAVAFEAWNSAGEFVRQWVHVVVVSRVPAMAERIAELPGLVADFDGRHAAWLDEVVNEINAGPFVLYRRDLETGADLWMDTVPAGVPPPGVPRVRLVRDGALLEYRVPNVSDVRKSVRIEIRGDGTVVWHDGEWFEDRAGEYYLWSDMGSVSFPGTRALWRGGPEGQVEVWPGRVLADVAPDGDVVFGVGEDSIMRYASGTVERVATGRSPSTDGASISYSRNDSLFLRLSDGSDQVVAPGAWVHEMRDGHLAYVNDGTLYVRGRDGIARAVPGSAGSDMRSLGAEGAVLFRKGGIYYLSRPPYPTAEPLYSSEMGLPEPRWVGADLYLLAGDAIFRF